LDESILARAVLLSGSINGSEKSAVAAVPDGDAKAARILALETAIARVHATPVETNDVRKGNNHWTRQDFASSCSIRRMGLPGLLPETTS